MVVIYFDDLGSNTICPELKAYRTHAVANLKPAPVIIYDYYDNCKFNQSFHENVYPTFFFSKLVVPEAFTILLKFPSVTYAMEPRNVFPIAFKKESMSFKNFELKHCRI